MAQEIMTEASGDGRTGRKLPRHYYTPQPIHEVAGVTRKMRDERSDLLTGTGEALIAAGVLTDEMLPAPDKCGIAWRPAGKQPEGGFWSWQPGYLEVNRRPDGKFTVRLTLSEEEQAARAAETKRRRHAEQEADQRKVAEHADNRKLLAAMSPEDLREQCLCRVEMIWSAVAGELGEQMSVEFGPSGKHRIGMAIGELRAAIAGAQIVDRRHAGRGKGHLSVVWSAS